LIAKYSYQAIQYLLNDLGGQV